MTVEKIEYADDEIVFHIHEPTRYGELDRFFTRTITRNEMGEWLLPTITRKEIGELPNDYPYELQEAEYHVVTSVGTVVFILMLILMVTTYQKTRYQIVVMEFGFVILI